MTTIDRRGLTVGEVVPSPIADDLQIVTGSSGTVAATTTLLVVQRSAPSSTALSLPSIFDVDDGWELRIIDLSTSVTSHAITLTPDGTETIMLATTWTIYSNSAQLGSLTLRANQTLNCWYIAP